MNENTLLTKIQDYIDLAELTISNASNLKLDNKIEELLRDKTTEVMQLIIKDLKSIIKDARHD